LKKQFKKEDRLERNWKKIIRVLTRPTTIDSLPKSDTLPELGRGACGDKLAPSLISTEKATRPLEEPRRNQKEREP